jgi:hypothetical protein
VTTTGAPADHGYVDGGPPPGPLGDVDSFPSDAEYARTLVARERRGSLSTLTEAGYPFGSVVSFVLDDTGGPTMCISALAEHTINARRDARASLLVAEAVAADADPLSAGRVTLVGTMVEQPTIDPVLRERYLDAHRSARFYVDYADFSWWTLQPESVRFVGGFGHMSWVGIDRYLAAEPDPLDAVARGICDHMNEDHADANLAYARRLLGVADATAASMTAVDRYGFTLAITTGSGRRTGRVAFPEPVRTSDQVRAAVVDLLAVARAMD